MFTLPGLPFPVRKISPWTENEPVSKVVAPVITEKVLAPEPLKAASPVKLEI